MASEHKDLRVSASKDELAAAVSRHTQALAAESIRERGIFTVAVSGGSLPASLAPLAKDAAVQWDKWHVLFVDERHVHLDHADSNYRATVQALLKDVPIPPGNVHPIDPHLELDACATAYQCMLGTQWHGERWTLTSERLPAQLSSNKRRRRAAASWISSCWAWARMAIRHRCSPATRC